MEAEAIVDFPAAVFFVAAATGAVFAFVATAAGFARVLGFVVDAVLGLAARVGVAFGFAAGVGALLDFAAGAFFAGFEATAGLGLVCNFFTAGLDGAATADHTLLQPH